MNALANSPYLMDLQARYRRSDFEREAAEYRLAKEAARPGRSLRQVVAGSLYALAARIEGQQPRRVTHEGAPQVA
jgi:hypothetical protein